MAARGKLPLASVGIAVLKNLVPTLGLGYLQDSFCSFIFQMGLISAVGVQGDRAVS